MRLDVDNLSVSRLRELFLEGRCRVTAYRLRQLRADRRRAVRQLGRRLQRRFQAEQALQRRWKTLLRLENEHWETGTRYVAGVDEAGMGPLAGPVVAAAVILPQGCRLVGVDDSKTLDAEMRQALEQSIRARAVAVSVGTAGVDEIDRINIYQAGLLAMQRAVAGLDPPPEQVLVDGRCIPALTTPQLAISGGDGCSLSIAAASIIAKTHRDRLMQDLDRAYPGYGFARHKGYCTPAHQEAVRRRGLCPAHRRSFKFLDEVQGAYSALFYELRAALSRLDSRADLTAVEARLDTASDLLSGDERRKLNVLLARRRRRLRGGR